MPGLERISPPQAKARAAETGRMRHGACEHLPRHRHDQGFAAVVLSGGYVEAGDTGRHRAEPGDVLLHRAWEHHLDRFDGQGAEVLVLPLGRDWAGPVHGRLNDPDAIVRLAERDPSLAAQQMLAGLTHKPPAATDWPDLLARTLRADPCACLAEWARTHGLHLGSVSRGFRQVFGVTPAAYRLTQRAHQAIDAMLRTQAPLSTIAQDCGFADQAHMSRAVARAAGVSPAALRRR